MPVTQNDGSDRNRPQIMDPVRSGNNSRYTAGGARAGRANYPRPIRAYFDDRTRGGFAEGKGDTL